MINLINLLTFFLQKNVHKILLMLKQLYVNLCKQIFKQPEMLLSLIFFFFTSFSKLFLGTNSDC